MTMLLRPPLLRRITHQSFESVKKFSSALHSVLPDESRDQSLTKFFNPTDEHSGLREMVRSFAEREVSSTTMTVAMPISNMIIILV